MERFYVRQEYIPNELVYLKENEHHHLSKVLRARVGEEIELVNGEGSLARARIETIEKDKTSVQILTLSHIALPSTQVFVGIPLMRPSKLEWVIEKGTEIGAGGFFLFPADHSTQDSLSDHQIERLGNITISALKQSKRLHLPHLEILPHLETLLTKEAKVYFGDVRETAPPLGRTLSGNTLFITGPESGFSEEEVILLSKDGKGVRLNPHVLRAETAPIVALSLLCALELPL